MYDTDVEVTYSVDLLPALVSEGEVQVYRYMRKQPGGGGCDCNYTAIKDTLSIDNWITNEIHEEGEFPVQVDSMTLVTLDSTTRYQIDKTKENTFVIGNANDSELQNIGYWSFTGSGINLFINLPKTETDVGNYLPIPFVEETDTYFKYSEETEGIYLYIYKTDYENYNKGDIVFVMSLEFSSGVDDTYLGYITFGPITPLSSVSEIPCAKFYKYNFPKDLKGTSITIDGLFSKEGNEDIRKTFTIDYAESFSGSSAGMNIYYDITAEETGNEFSAMAYLLNENIPQFAPDGFIYVLPVGGPDSYNLTKIFSLTTTGMAPVTYTYTNENIKINSAIKVYLNDSENIQIIDRQDGYIEFKRSKVANIPFNMEILDTDEEGLVTLFNSYKEPVPTKLSQFQNDTKYLTARNIDYRSPIQIITYDDDIEIRIGDNYNVALAQYSGYPQTGTLDVDSWVEVSDGYTYTINYSDIFNDNTDVVMTVNSPIMLEAVELTRGTFKIKAKSKPTEPIPYTYKSLATRTKGQLTIVNGYMPTIPTKVSEFENDSGYITQLVTETLQGTKRYKTFEDLTDCVLEAGQYDAEGKYVYCV